MKTRIFTITVLAIMFLTGCAGQMHSRLDTKTDGEITHDAWSASLFLPPPGPIALAESYRIKKQADTMDKMMTSLQEGKTVAAASGKFLIGLINNDRSHGVYLYHPEIPGLKLMADPKGGSQVFEVRDIPYEIVLYSMTGDIIKKIKPRYEPDYEENIAHKKLVGNILVDLRIKINRAN